MLNTIAIVGRLTRDPEIATTNDGSQVTNFTLVFSQGVKADGQEDVAFISVKSFNKLANTCSEWLSKGDKVAIEGRLYIKSFVRKDGSKGLDPTIIANNLEFVDVLKSGNTEEQSAEEVEETQEIPFEPAPEVKVPEKASPKAVAKPTRNRR